MGQEKEYYLYEHKLGTDKMEIKELEYYRGEELDVVNVFVDNLGNWNFFMYSDSKDNKEMFLRKISKTLLEDAQTASRMAATAHGRFMTFDEHLKNIKS